MKRQFVFTILTIGLWACNNGQREKLTDQTSTSKIITEDSKYNSFNLQFNNPTILDSSDWVIYPLILEELEESDRGFISSSYERQQAYWNIAFYNTGTKQTRLLSESLKMLINSIHPINDTNYKVRPKGLANEKLIYYSITTKDYNQDGKLSSQDPKYLFISDLSGQNLQQVSPDNYDLIHWETIYPQNKIILHALKDINSDKKFDSSDESVAFVYDIESQTLEQIFSEEFNLMTKKILDIHWAKK